MRPLKSLSALLALFLLMTTAHSAGMITGAGASFPAPVYAKWAAAYHQKTGKQLNYQSIGSSGGIKQITAKTVDFGASDAPLSIEELAEKKLIQFPTVIGGVVPVVNIKGIQSGQLKLTGAVLAQIFMGDIKYWNDQAITVLNPGLNLPKKKIAIVRRADGSGTTFIFTNYLAKVSEKWSQQLGVGKVIQWPIGFGGKGNEGVSAFVKRAPGSIGYVEYAYAKENGLADVQLKNSSGQFVKASEESFKAASAEADWEKSGYGEILTNQPGEVAWPISGATFILLHEEQSNLKIAKEILDFFFWALKEGDSMASELGYAPLPDSLTAKIEKSWSKIKSSSGEKVW